MNYRPIRTIVCALSLVGCSSANTGDTETGTAPLTGSSGDVQTGTDAAASTTEADDSSTGTPTTDPGTTSQTTGDPEPTTGSSISLGSTGEPPETGSDTTAGASSSTGEAAVTASAELAPKSGSMATGTVLFTDLGDGVDLVITVSGVEPPGTHALHIHEFPDCSAADGTSTGNHWNPNGTMLGELGTIEIGPDGTGVFMKTDAWSIGTGAFDDVVDHSIIIHADDNGGTRIACGVITLD